LVSLAQVKNRTDLPVVSLAYLYFIMLGMPGALLGIAWPSMRQTFELPLDAVGLLLATSAAGYTLSSFYSGRLVYRLGYPRLLVLSSLLGVAGAVGYVVAPLWWTILLAGAVMGAGGGMIDAGLNTYFAANYGPRLMSWLHASFGIGTTLAPLMMTALLRSEAPWQWGYAVIALANLLLVAGVAFTVRQWQPPEMPAATPDGDAVSLWETLRLPVVWLNTALIILVVGLEFSPGQWTYSLFTESRSMTVELAGLMVTLYWGSFTVGRILFGFIGNNLKRGFALRACMAAAGIGAVLVWLDAGPVVNFLGVIVMGLAQAPIFPLIVTATPARVGSDHAANAIGFLISAAGIGIAVLPGVIGVLATSLGLESIGPMLVVMAVTMFTLHEVLTRYGSPKPKRDEKP
jgi:fucose permease